MSWIRQFLKVTPLVFHVFVAVAIMIYLVAVVVCGHHGIGQVYIVCTYNRWIHSHVQQTAVAYVKHSVRKAVQATEKSSLRTSTPSMSINVLTRYCWRWPMLRDKLLQSSRTSLNWTHTQWWWLTTAISWQMTHRCDITLVPFFISNRSRLGGT